MRGNLMAAEGRPGFAWASPTAADGSAGDVDRGDMIKVKQRGTETTEQMLRRFKKMCEKEGLTKDMKKYAYYEKPSEKRRRRSRKSPRLPR